MIGNGERKVSESAFDRYIRQAGRRKAFVMWIVYIRYAGEKLFFPKCDVHGCATAYPTKKSAAAALYEAKQYQGRKNAYLQKVGPIC